MSEIYIGGGHKDHDQVDALRKAIVGLTIVGVIDLLPKKDPGWDDHGSVRLLLSNGSSLECGGWGHDAWGPSITYSERAREPELERILREIP